MSQYIHKSHNVSVLMYHFVCPAKYRKLVFSKVVDEELKQICQEISARYEIIFIEIGTDSDHVHFLVQSVPTYAPTKLIQLIKSIAAKELFLRHPDIKKQLWGGELWSKGYYVSTVGQYGNEDTIANYVKNQGKENNYKILLKEEMQQILF